MIRIFSSVFYWVVSLFLINYRKFLFITVNKWLHMFHNYLDANLAFIIFCFVVSFLPPLCIHFNFLVLFRKIPLQIFKNIILIFFFILLNFSLEKSLYNLFGTWYCIYIWFFFQPNLGPTMKVPWIIYATFSPT